jgi:hypothetical protein
MQLFLKDSMFDHCHRHYAILDPGSGNARWKFERVSMRAEWERAA